MGQHKYNPNCQLAREGKLPPKPKPMSKRERERLLFAECQRILLQPLVNAYVKMQQDEERKYSGIFHCEVFCGEGVGGKEDGK